METRNIGVSQLMNDKIIIHSTSKLMRIMSKFVKIFKNGIFVSGYQMYSAKLFV